MQQASKERDEAGEKEECSPGHQTWEEPDDEDDDDRSEAICAQNECLRHHGGCEPRQLHCDGNVRMRARHLRRPHLHSDDDDDPSNSQPQGLSL